MATFIYTAKKSKSSKELVHGEIEARDKAAAIDSLADSNLVPITLSEKKTKKKLFSFGVKKVKDSELVLFTRQLSSMIGAGLPLVKSLRSLQDNTETDTFKKILRKVGNDVESGQQFSDALARHPETFDSIYINMVRAGETAGILEDILKRLASQQEKSLSIKRKVKSAMVYPVILITIASIAFLGLMIFVVPRIGATIKDLGGPNAQLPAITQVMLAISHFIVNYWYILLAIIGGGLYMFNNFKKTDKGRDFMSRVMLKAPAINKVTKKLASARFARTYASLIAVGVPVIESINITSKAIGNSIYERTLAEISGRVKNGELLSDSMSKHEDLFPDMLIQIFRVGEETGATDEILVKIADYYEEEFDVAIDGLSSILEPMMIIFVGAIVGLIAVSVMLPIMTMSNSIA